MIQRFFHLPSTALLVLFCTLPIRAAERLPAPEGAELDAALKLVREVYGKAYASATAPANKEALAQKILATARDSADTTNRFAALRVARDIAIQAGSVEAAFAAIEQLDKEYEIDAGPMKLDAVTQVAANAVTPEPVIGVAKANSNACVAASCEMVMALPIVF